MCDCVCNDQPFCSPKCDERVWKTPPSSSKNRAFLVNLLLQKKEIEDIRFSTKSHTAAKGHRHYWVAVPTSPPPDHSLWMRRCLWNSANTDPFSHFRAQAMHITAGSQGCSMGHGVNWALDDASSSPVRTNTYYSLAARHCFKPFPDITILNPLNWLSRV